jgi:hypothetical protein
VILFLDIHVLAEARSTAVQLLSQQRQLLLQRCNLLFKVSLLLRESALCCECCCLLLLLCSTQLLRELTAVRCCCLFESAAALSLVC